MKSFAQTLDLKNDPQMIAAYVEWHTKVYPEVLLALRKVGVSKMKIFLLGTHLFMYYEVLLPAPPPTRPCPSNLFSPPPTSTIKAPDDFDPTRDFQAYTRSCRSLSNLFFTLLFDLFYF
jgi:hypothetical protein